MISAASNAPRSQRGPYGRLTPRWSRVSLIQAAAKGKGDGGVVRLKRKIPPPRFFATFGGTAPGVCQASAARRKTMAGSLLHRCLPEAEPGTEGHATPRHHDQHGPSADRQRFVSATVQSCEPSTASHRRMTRYRVDVIGNMNLTPFPGRPNEAACATGIHSCQVVRRK